MGVVAVYAFDDLDRFVRPVGADPVGDLRLDELMLMRGAVHHFGQAGGQVRVGRCDREGDERKVRVPCRQPRSAQRGPAPFDVKARKCRSDDCAISSPAVVGAQLRGEFSGLVDGACPRSARPDRAIAAPADARAAARRDGSNPRAACLRLAGKEPAPSRGRSRCTDRPTFE